MRLLSNLISKIIGSRNDRVIRKFKKSVNEINNLESSLERLSNVELKAKTTEFKNRLNNGETLDSLLPEAFAVVREAGKRTLKMRHFDVQLIGGMVLHGGNISEMCTGEGKTLVATLPLYLNALAGKGAHLVTVNDYLAQRDADWMRPIYECLGMTVGVILSGQKPDEKKAAYQADITYGTNNEFGFDYLRDNMVFTIEERVQRDLHFAVVDEVDSILIDEARTPLIISGEAEDSSATYVKMDKIAPQLVKQASKDSPGDYYVDEKDKQVFLSETGHAKVEDILVKEGMLNADESLYDAKNIALVHFVTSALRAYNLYQKDVDYIVKNNEVVIVDEHTGRTMEGRRWSDGLHQAIEAKERVKIQSENQTLASTTFQNYFRLYDKLSGMTGTADTEAYEFHQIYQLEVIVIPTNKPLARKDEKDLIYFSEADKFDAIIEEIIHARNKNQPLLVGTASIETSELLSSKLTRKNIPHQVLNAKFHKKEADIIAEAGRPGAVTIATNMAGRGTDIVLGGNLSLEISQLDNPTEEQLKAIRDDWNKRHETVLNAGGLYVIGTERHESRRIDNQLRGRSGRQGDPGRTRFYLSIEDNLLRIFGGDRLKNIMARLGMEKGSSLESGLLTRCIENAQRKVEAFNFDIRKQLLEYDDVANDQRKVVYEQRSKLMALEDVSNTIHDIRDHVMETVFRKHIPQNSLEEQWDLDNLEEELRAEFGMICHVKEWLSDDGVDEEAFLLRIQKQAQETYEAKEASVSPEMMRQLEKSVLLQNLDMLWKEHLSAMDHLRQGISLRSYAQKNPKQEYKRESFALFEKMLETLKYNTISLLSRMQVQEEDARVVEEQRKAASHYTLNMRHDSDLNALSSQDPTDEYAKVEPFRRDAKVGRNDPCPCGSGRKYKKCHGEITQSFA